MVFLFSAALFFSAFLLFLLEPMVGKVLLPFYGGTPAVWNVCLVFFQLMLLAGYFYASRVSRIRNFRWQLCFHSFLFFAAAFFLKTSFFAHSIQYEPSIEWPATSLFRLLFRWLAVPFLLLASTSSLVSHWFSLTKHPHSDNPYLLFVASNVGSLLALIAYPFFFEPHLLLSRQFLLWDYSYSILGFLVLACGVSVRRPNIDENPPTNSSTKNRVLWFCYSFIPSALLIGINTYLSTEVASFPLLWLIPLALYLLTFIFAFSQLVETLNTKGEFFLGRAAAFLVCVVFLGVILESGQPALLFLPANLVLFFLVSLLSHSRLAKLKPEKQLLTQYYFWISLGGAAGGLIFTFVTPCLFSSVPEYPLLLLLGASFRPGSPLGQREPSPLSADIFYGLFVATLFISLSKLCLWWGFTPGRLFNLLVLGPPMLLAYRQVAVPRKYAITLFFLFVFGSFFFAGRGQLTIFRFRSFYSLLKIETDAKQTFQMMFHGNTLHGRQFLDLVKRNIPIGYYSTGSPVGDIFRLAKRTMPEEKEVVVVGLGAGTLAAFAGKNENWKFFELDPKVIQVAQENFFYLRDSAAFPEHLKVFPGDARINLEKEKNQTFDLLILDAFSSDSIPLHLLTREAMKVYSDKLKPGGLLVFHISSWYFNLVAPIANLAKEIGAEVTMRSQFIATEEEEREGTLSSDWMMVSKNQEAINEILKKKDWQRVVPNKAILWTDNYSNILSVLKGPNP